MYHKPILKTFLSLFAILGLAIGVLAGSSGVAAGQDNEADLSIALKAPQHVEPGTPYVVHVIFNNIGTAASPQDSWVKVTLPAGTNFVSAADLDGNDLPPDAVDGNSLTWQVGSIAPDACFTHILVTVQVDESLPEETALTVQGEIGSSAAETSLDNNTGEVTSIVCEMAGSTQQAHRFQVKPGDVVTYTISLRMRSRQGAASLSERNVELTDTLPPSSQVRFLGWVGDNTGTFDGEHLHWQGRVRAGEPVTLQYQLGIEGEVPPGSQVTNRANIAWSGGEMEIDPVNIETYLDENGHMFGSQGGQWQFQAGLQVDVPPNAVQETTRFEFRALFEENPPEDAPAGWIYSHRAFELTAFQFSELHQFNQPLTLTIGYTDQDAQGLDHSTLRLWYRSGPGEPWAMLGEPQTHQNGQISFNTDHFTEFALFGQGAYRVILPVVR